VLEVDRTKWKSRTGAGRWTRSGDVRGSNVGTIDCLRREGKLGEPAGEGTGEEQKKVRERRRDKKGTINQKTDQG